LKTIKRNLQQLILTPPHPTLPSKGGL